MNIRSTTVLEAIFGLKGNLAQGLRPTPKVSCGVEIAPFRDDAAAAVCISADFEMGWGWRSRGLDGATNMGERERQNVPLILSLLEEYSVPITWATVGHLFLDSCTRSHSGLAHPTMPRPISDGTWSGDWYWPDPCTNFRESPAWYGPDLIQRITESTIGHEIGTHSFSHINFQAQFSSADVVRSELDACIEVMKPFGVKPRTLIFPRHQAEYSYLPLLADAGVTVIRHRDDRIRLSYPERMASGIYRVYESMNLRIAKHYDYLEKVKIFIAKAMERRATYALWFHPSDPTEWFDPQLRAILTYLAAERRKRRLWITTMHELAAYCEARDQLQLRIERGQHSVTIGIESSFDSSKYGAVDVTLLMSVPAEPKSVALCLADGQRIAGDWRLAFDGSTRAVINVPTSAKSLRLAF